MAENHYDYIITGGGAAGLSVLHRLLHSSLQHKRILVLDRALKNENDRTWCFWEKKTGPFEHIVHHCWQRLWFHEGNASRLLHIAPYTYKVIRGIDFYREMERLMEQFPNVTRLLADVEDIRHSATGVEVQANGQVFTAEWCFNSIYRGAPPDKNQVNYLDQHFRGWFIRTQQPAFDPSQATLMDFRTPQHGETRFLYVLPFSAHEALVEVAIFSNQHLSAAGYDEILRNYLAQYHADAGDYEITFTEQGVIPMTDFAFPRAEGRIIHLGMAGGDTRASTGYTFWNIQHRADRIVRALERGQNPAVSSPFHLLRAQKYDALLLYVLQKGLYPGAPLFRKLFLRNPPARILAFLNAETTFWQELVLMHTLPIPTFIRALFSQVHRLVR